jgi:hypothetical protein
MVHNRNRSVCKQSLTSLVCLALSPSVLVAMHKKCNKLHVLVAKNLHEKS